MFLPGESQGQGSLVGFRLWGRTESDTTEVTKQQQQVFHNFSSKEQASFHFMAAITIRSDFEAQENKVCSPVMAPHSSTLAWKIPWTEEPGGLRSMGSLRVGHD